MSGWTSWSTRSPPQKRNSATNIGSELAASSWWVAVEGPAIKGFGLFEVGGV